MSRSVTRRALTTVIAATVLTLAHMASSESLLDVYEIALDNDAQLRAETARYRADLELKTLSLAPLLPQVRAGASRALRDSQNTRLTITEFQGGQVVIDDVTNGSRTFTNNYDISLSQPCSIFRLGLTGRQAVTAVTKPHRRWLLLSKILLLESPKPILVCCGPKTI